MKFLHILSCNQRYGVSDHLETTKIETQGFYINLPMNKKKTTFHIPFWNFSLSMNTDVNYNPFAPARSLSLQFMIQAVTTSFDPILVMLISPHNGSKSVWFNCGNCVSASRVCVWEEWLLGALVCLTEWAYMHGCVFVCLYYSMRL